MAMKDNLVTDSILSLIYVEKRGESKGYRRDIVTEKIPNNIRKYVFCSHCEGISRKPRFSDNGIYCTVCSIDICGTFDAIVEEFVLQLKCRCPLSTRGCDWIGQLRDIEKHMTVCGKLKTVCGIGCGRVLERCDRTRHHVLCPLRIHASKANRHITCQEHTDEESIYPNKEVLDKHSTGFLFGHHMSLLQEIHQLKSEINKLRDKSEGDKCSISGQIENLERRNVNIQWKVWLLFGIVAVGVAIFISLLHSERDLHADIQLVSESTQSNKLSILSLEQYIQLNKQGIQSNKQDIQSNKKSIQSHEQLTYYLLSRGTHLHEYIEDRDKTLQGVEWIHRAVKGEAIYGPTFYVGKCKLRLHVASKKIDIDYYVTRLEGRSDVTSSCHITGFVVYVVNALDSTESSSQHKTHDVKLGVRDEYKFYTKFFNKEGIRILKVYFDVK